MKSVTKIMPEAMSYNTLTKKNMYLFSVASSSFRFHKIFRIHEMNFERDCNPDQLSFIFAIFNDISQKHFPLTVVILKIIQSSLKINCAILNLSACMQLNLRWV